MSSLLEVLEGFFRGMEYLGKKKTPKGIQSVWGEIRGWNRISVRKIVDFCVGINGLREKKVNRMWDTQSPFSPPL